MINWIVSIFILGILAVSVFRVLGFGGIPFKENKYTKWILCKNKSYNSYTIGKKEFVKVFLGAMCFRIIVYIVSAVALRMFMENDASLDFSGFINKWLQWDGNNYTRIATVGYGGYLEEGEPSMLVFFPFYSWLIKFCMLLIKDVYIAALVVSSICYGIGCCYFYALVCMDYGKEIAKRSLIYLSVFPFAFFYGSMMPESCFFALSAACFYYIRKHKWSLAALTGAMASISRMQGLLLMLPAALEWIEYYKPFLLIRKKKWKELWKVFYSKALWIPAMAAGTLSYLYLNYVVSGNPFKFLQLQKTIWHQQGQYFGEVLTGLFQRAFTTEHSGVGRVSIWIPEVFIFVLTVILLIYAVRKHHSKYVLYLLAYTITNYSLSWLLSAGRYMSVALPVFIFMACFAEEHKWADKWITVVSSMLFGIYLIGYLMSLQIF